MPKLKTNKSVKKRFKVTARGKVLFRRPGKSHLQSAKSAKRRRHLRSEKRPDNPLWEAKLKSMLPGQI